MDTRAILCTALTALAMICGTILLVTNQAASAATLFALASTFGGYVVGLYSEPFRNEPADNEDNADA